MAESKVSVSEGSGKNLHTWDRTISSVLVQDQFTLPGEYPLASYSMVFPNVSIATVNDHIAQIMAGGTNYVRIRRIRVYSIAGATATTASYSVFRVTTAGTGGGTVTARPMDVGDAAAGATGMTLPTAKGTESVELYRLHHATIAAAPIATKDAMDEWVAAPGSKGILIPAGTSNGIVLKSLNAVAATQVVVEIDFVETAWLGS